MGTPRPTREEQAVEVIERLREEYPDSGNALDYTNRFELLVAVVLSAQCTDERVNQVTPELFERYPDAESLAAANESEVAEVISSITFYNNKAGYLVEGARILVDEHGGEVPDSMAALTELPGVGRKTANVVLQYGHEIVEGVVVDTHVQRLAQRLGLVEVSDPEAVEAELMEIVPETSWKEVTDLLIAHGRAVCGAKNPDCGNCVVEGLCPSSQLDREVDLASGREWKEGWRDEYR